MHAGDNRYSDLMDIPTPGLAALGDSLMSIDTPAARDSAMTCMTLIINRFNDEKASESDVEMTVKALTAMHYIYNTHLRDSKQGYAMLRRAERILDTHTGHDEMKGLLYLNIGVLVRNSEILLNTTSHPAGVDYFAKALDACMTNRQWRLAAISLYDLAEVYFEEGNAAGLTPYSARWRREVPDSVKPRFNALDRMLDAIDAFKASDWKAAEHNLLKMLTSTTGDILLDKALLTKSVLYRAIIMEKTGRHQRADIMLDSLADIVKKLNMPMAEVWYHENLHRFYLNERGDTAKAREHELLYYKTRENVSARDGIFGIDDSRFQDHMHRLEILSRREAVKQQTTRLTIICAGITAVVVIVALVLLLRNSRRRHRLLLSLYEKNLALLNNASQPLDDPPAPVKYSGSSMDDNTLDILVRRIRSIMNDPAHFTSPDFSLRKLANLSGSNTAYVSQTINQTTGKTFKELLNEKRIAHACLLMNDTSRCEKLTVEAIANDVGFKSRTAFAASFKAMTGLTPTEFRHFAQERAANPGQN